MNIEKKLKYQYCFLCVSLQALLYQIQLLFPAALTQWWLKNLDVIAFPTASVI